jgi:ABC-type multidrug transport system ATPase subunit/peptidoglycan/LPS O-acetylase OafA/YrhL
VQPTERLHALDAVRGFALIAGVVLHATMSFLPGFSAQGWPLTDNASSVALGVTFYVIHIFRMTTFFVIAGFFGRMLLHRGGVRAFVSNRSTRVVIPLVVGWIVFFPMVATAMVWARGAAPPPGEILRQAALSFPLAHLWFLYVLTLMYAAALIVRQGVIEPIDRTGHLRAWVDRQLRRLTAWWVLPLVLAAPLLGVLALSPAWARWFGIPTPDTSLIPNAPAMVAFGTAFLFGWLLQRQPDLLRVIERRWALHFVLAVSLTAACLSITGLAPEYMRAAGRSTLPYAFLYTVSVWCWTFAVLGIGLRFFASESATRRYVADASYWIYLAHLPVLFWLQLAVKDLPWHWSVKFAVIMTVAMVVLFASYHFLVRYTLIGETLNGPRRRRASPRLATRDSGSDRSTCLASLSDVRKRYDKTVALDGLSLEVRPGELLAVLGPNGAGKSTAISLMLGLQEPDSGSVRLFGVAPDRLEARTRIGVMMQEACLAQELRVRELIDLTTSYYPAPLSVNETMVLTHTTALADRPYAKLSAGQKRQVQFALAVCGRPALLFLDEPTVGLDVQARETLWATLRQLLSQGSSIVLTTHYLEEAEALANRVAVLAKGRLIAAGSVDEMRALVARKRIRCTTTLTPDLVRSWSGVTSASFEGAYLQIVATDADAVVRRLLATDAHARDLEVQRAGLAEAFTELTQEAA